jgi:hypothetical protein
MFPNNPLLFINLRAAHIYLYDRALNKILPSRKTVSLQKRGAAHYSPSPRQRFLYSDSFSQPNASKGMTKVNIKVAIYSKSGVA